MAQQRPDGGSGNLALRIRSAAIFVPVTVAAFHFGFPWFDALIVAAAGLMLWEWARICGSGRFGVAGWAMEASVVAALVALYLGQAGVSVALLAGAAAGFAILGRSGERAHWGYLALGVALVGAFCIAFLAIRAAPEYGRTYALWLLFAVWITDTGAYFSGRAIGGPRLAPRISPKKTWAGLVGGTLCAALWSVLWLPREEGMTLPVAVAAGVLAGLLAQAGDLSVSVVKRRFGVKDASGLVPGHGGVLDRLDGMLLTAPALALVLALLSGGGGGA